MHIKSGGARCSSSPSFFASNTATMQATDSRCRIFALTQMMAILTYRVSRGLALVTFRSSFFVREKESARVSIMQAELRHKEDEFCNPK